MSTSLSTVQPNAVRASAVPASAVQTAPVTTVVSESSATTSRFADYVELCKPRILAMALIAMAVAGVAAAAGTPNWFVLMHALIGTAIVAASSSIFNQAFERHVDLAMHRTENRPIAAGRIQATEAYWLAAGLLVIGTAYLIGSTNYAVVVLAVLTWFLYAAIYTPLKQLTVWNTAVGAVPGALPILIGWAAGSGGTIDNRGLWLFAILFVWQFPHFMAIAWIYKSQYANAGFRMMSHDDEVGRRSGITAVVGASILLGLVVLQPMVGMGSVLAIVPAALLAIGQLSCSLSFLKETNDYSARRLLRASLIFLPAHLIIITLSQFGIL